MSESSLRETGTAVAFKDGIRRIQSTYRLCQALLLCLQTYPQITVQLYTLICTVITEAGLDEKTISYYVIEES